jgi:cytochrome b pre-mRNA-processing protein 3
MPFSLFRTAANRKVIDRIHGEIVAASRDPDLFRSYGVDDSLDGRFESLTLHAAFVLRRLNALPQPGPDVAQDVTDALFRHLDVTLREMGIGDTSVPKHMKKMAEAFFGRAKAYCAEGIDEKALALSLSRNVYGGKKDGARLSRYIGDLDRRLADMSLADFMDRPIPFPKPGSID